MFSIQGRFYQGCQLIYRLLCINFLFVVFSLPIITIGASFSAMIQTIDHDEGNLFSGFYQAFKGSFLGSLPLMGFNLFSILFFMSLRAMNIGNSSFLNLLIIIFLSFIFAYNVNLYLVTSFITVKNLFYQFQATFYFTIGTFFKTFLLPLVFAILAYFFFIILKIYFLFFIFSLPCAIYLFILKKDRLKVEENLATDGDF